MGSLTNCALNTWQNTTDNLIKPSFLPMSIWEPSDVRILQFVVSHGNKGKRIRLKDSHTGSGPMGIHSRLEMLFLYSLLYGLIFLFPVFLLTTWMLAFLSQLQAFHLTPFWGFSALFYFLLEHRTPTGDSSLKYHLQNLVQYCLPETSILCFKVDLDEPLD